jgi:hypothetical protein
MGEQMMPATEFGVPGKIYRIIVQILSDILCPNSYDSKLKPCIKETDVEWAVECFERSVKSMQR